MWWNGWLALTDDARDPRVSTFATATPPAVLSRDAGHADVFVMGNDGRVWTTWWAQGVNNSRWNPWFPITDDPNDPTASRFSTATPPAVLSRDAGHADLFVMGNDGRVWTTWWAQGVNNNRWNPWFPITDDPNDPAASRFSTATPPAVLSRDAGHADVFVMGTDGRVWTTWWAQGINNNRWNPWFPITDNPDGRSVSTFSKASPPAALARGSARMDLFLIGTEARVWTNWWGVGAVQYVPRSTVRICQLTANDDPEGLPHVNRTLEWGCDGTDLGIPVDHDGRLYLFFGDVSSHGDADPITYTYAHEPDPSKLLLTPVLKPASSEFRPYNIVGTAKGYLGLFETPTGGFSYDGQLWVFCVMGFNQPVSHLTVSSDPADDFDNVFTLSQFSRPCDRFFLVAPQVIKNQDVHGLPDEAAGVEDGVLLWGQAGGGRAPDGTLTWSYVYLAWMPLTRGHRPRFEDIRYRCEDGSWCGEQSRAGSLFEVPEVTLLSVGWIPGIQRWVMLYTRAADHRPLDGIVCRVAAYPWIWSDEVTIFNAERDAAYGRFMHWPDKDDLDVPRPVEARRYGVAIRPRPDRTVYSMEFGPANSHPLLHNVNKLSVPGSAHVVHDSNLRGRLSPRTCARRPNRLMSIVGEVSIRELSMSSR